MVEVLNFIDGRMCRAASGESLENIEPATGAPMGTLPDSGAADVTHAVDAARAALGDWASAPVARRGALLTRLADLIERDLEELARAETIDQGKPVALARRVDIPRAAANFRFFASAAQHLADRVYQTDAPAVGEGRAMNYTHRTPRGVAGCISPWNLPLYLFTWKVAPALAAGCTVVAKPSELTPVTAWMLCRLAQEAGIPPGVLNVVHGRGEAAGAALVEHPDVPSISLTGGTATGRRIAAVAGPMFKRLSLELGGKNPFVIFDDADLPGAIAAAVRAAFTNQGQICLCGSRVLAQRRVYQRVLEGLAAGAEALRVGDPREEGTEQGPLVSKAHREKVDSYVQMARSLGGRVLCGGAPVAVGGRCAGGWFYAPTVLADLDPRCPVEQEEIFGPVVSVAPFDTEEEAIALANGTPYGLAATVWTRDVSRAHRVAQTIDAGVVWVNTWMLRDLRVPFGGMKHSGLGREGGEDALRFFTEERTICIALDPPQERP